MSKDVLNSGLKSHIPQIYKYKILASYRTKSTGGVNTPSLALLGLKFLKSSQTRNIHVQCRYTCTCISACTFRVISFCEMLMLKDFS